MRRFFLLSLFLLIFWPALLQARGIEPRLIAEGPAPAGGEVDLAIHMQPAPGWHGYWLNPGDAGLPMDVEWHLPKGFSAGPLRYPAPTRLTVAGLMNYVFERDYAVLVRLRVPSNASGVIPIRADARWLACTDKICVPEKGTLGMDLPVGSGTPNRNTFDVWRRELAQPIATLGRFAADGNELHLAIPLPSNVEIHDPYVFPVTERVVDYEAPQRFRRSGNWLVADLSLKEVPSRFEGVLASSGGRALEFRALPGFVPRGGTPLGGLGWNAILLAVVGAIAGGVLLNLMPCVFPILALKALHISRAGGEARTARIDSFSYVGGAMFGTGALGVILIAIRAAGAEAGWAFQLQDPRTIMLLFLLALAISANLLGLFELPVLGGGLQPAGSFGTGALTAFVATPCAGPFLGAALGTALILPPIGSIAVFAALGFGLGLPFLILAFIPALQRRMPRPGRWMDRLKRFLAIPMVASAVGALWLLGRQTGERGLLIGLVAGAGLLFAAQQSGSLQRRGKGGAWMGALAALALVALGIGLVPQSRAAIHSISGAETWDETQVSDYVRQGRPAFVYFTADWCLSCKVNEAAAIDRSEVRAAFKTAGVRIFAGDWTNGDPKITRFLESRGRAGVPLYLWYSPGKSPEELPQVLTPAMLISRAQAVTR